MCGAPAATASAGHGPKGSGTRKVGAWDRCGGGSSLKSPRFQVFGAVWVHLRMLLQVNLCENIARVKFPNQVRSQTLPRSLLATGHGRKRGE